MKSKKIITILLSLAIMVTFMPAMAFAGTNPSTYTKSWSDKATTVQDNNGDTFNTARVFDNTTGLVRAEGKDNDPTVGKLAPSDGVLFYDFDSSVLGYGANAATKATKLDGTNWDQATFAGTTTLYVMLVQPDYDANYTTAANATFRNVALTKSNTAEADGGYKWVGNTSDNKYVVTAKQSKYDTTDIFTTQTVTFDVTIAANGSFSVDGTAAGPDMFGKTASATITVNPAKKTVNNAQISIDGVKSTAVNANGSATLTGQYDGAAHKVVADEVEGYTVSWKVLNRNTNKYEAVSEVSVTDVAKSTERVNFQVIYTNNTTKVEEKYTHEIQLNAATAVGFGFVDGTKAKVGTNGYPEYYVDGTSYDAASYVEFAPTKRSKDDAAYKVLTTDEDKEQYLAVGAAYENAASVNSATLLEAFNAYYDIKETVDKYDKNKVTLAFDTKDLKTAEKTALNTKYEQLFRNFGVAGITNLINNSRNTATVWLNSDVIDEEVEFTKAPTVKTYKGSKTTKAGKLKKNQSFTVTAVSNKGRVINYKLVNVNTSKIKINKTTGKITVKKGLTKGTYTVKVKAYVPGYSTGIGALYETQTIKIKIKK